MIKNWIVSIVIITTLVVGGVSAQHGRAGGLRMKRNLTPSGKTEIYSQSPKDLPPDPVIPRPSPRRVISLPVLKEEAKPRKVQDLPVQMEVLLPNPRREHIGYSPRHRRTVMEVQGLEVAMPKHRRTNQDQPDLTVMPRPIKLLLLIDLPTLPKQRRARPFDCKDIRFLLLPV